MRTLAIRIAAAVVLLAAARAEAEESKEIIKAGVPIDTLTPPGMTREKVLTFEADKGLGGAYLVYSSGDTRELIRVVVAPDGETARAMLGWMKRVSEKALPRVTDVGDEAYGDAGLWVVVRHNVAVTVLAKGVSARAEAERIVTAIDHAPAGSPAGAAPRVTIAPLKQGVATPLAIEGDVAAEQVHVEGPASERSTKQGWVITRNGDGEVTISVTGVDSRLRHWSTKTVVK